MTLKNLEFNILASSLTIVIRLVASGKSTLCKVLLGETPVYDGHHHGATAIKFRSYQMQPLGKTLPGTRHSTRPDTTK
jgi:ABC-type protease/lipase transport system fused ATPase/permease subunit